MASNRYGDPNAPDATASDRSKERTTEQTTEHMVSVWDGKASLTSWPEADDETNTAKVMERFRRFKPVKS